MNLKDWILGGAVCLALLLGFVGLNSQGSTMTGPQGPRGIQGVQGDVGPQGPAGRDGVDGYNGSDGKDGKPSFGAVSVLTSPQDWNGVTTINENRRLAPGTSTVVSLPTSKTGTSTLAIVCKGGGLTFAQEYEIAIGSTPNSTTTRSLGKLYVPANRTAMVIASTTGVVFGESGAEFINMKMATTSGTTVSTLLTPTGSCSFEGIAI